jgi:hypothetical protein
MTKRTAFVFADNFVFRYYVQIGRRVSMSDDEEKAVSIQSLTDAQLIAILQFDDSDENDPNSIVRIVEAEVVRRKKEGGSH